MSKTKFYHSSQKRFKKGDTLVCPTSVELRNFNCCEGVFITTNSVPHITIWSEVLNKTGGVWYVYEVEPIGKICFGMWNDIICQSATIVGRVGDARGILLNYKKTIRKHPEGWDKVNEKAFVHNKRFKEMKKKW
jgi:hypothetical protein